MSDAINGVWNSFSVDDGKLQEYAGQTLEQTFTAYASLVYQLPVDGLVDPHIPIEDYLRVNTQNDPVLIEAQIKAEYGQDSIGSTFTDAVDMLVAGYQINHSLAARFVAEYVNVHLGSMTEMAKALITGGVLPEHASRQAFATILQHIELEDIPAVQHNSIERGLDVKKAHALYIGQSTPERHEALLISQRDSESFIRAYHLQDRPYTVVELQAAQLLLEGNSQLTHALLAFHLLLVQHAQSVIFEERPELLSHSLEPHNTLVVPVYDPTTRAVMGLAPNPKFLKTMAANWLPAIAREMLASYSYDEVAANPQLLTPEDISRGIASCPGLSLFNTTIGAMKWHGQSGEYVDLLQMFHRLCPAKTSVTVNGVKTLPILYERLIDGL